MPNHDVAFLTLIGWITYLTGIVLATGNMVLVAILFPPYGWYLIVERLMQHLGIVS